ncbi:hypothetical protein [Bosea sp. PAMC 26642]|uniref:hypothetical protein n=1 Tax=Bosea sp. (strain PAMC 26642) TaxID=1792307 RepID=UPI00076FE3B5|nr:hypothetical protein [Bosea sp. PAMC 26642]AMJ58990.1 hypothetical protein AXW83_00575 [Bosea sp. PAMC 26642]
MRDRDHFAYAVKMALSRRAGKHPSSAVGDACPDATVALGMKARATKSLDRNGNSSFSSYTPEVRSFRDDSFRIIPVKKIVLSVATVVLLAGFAAGCAKTEKPTPAPVVRKG